MRETKTSLLTDENDKNIQINKRNQFCTFIRFCWKEISIRFSINICSKTDIQNLQNSYLITRVSEEISLMCCFGIKALNFGNILFYFISAAGILLLQIIQIFLSIHINP